MIDVVYAQTGSSLGGNLCGNGVGLGPIAKLLCKNGGESEAVSALSAITGIVSSIIGIMTVAAIIWLLFQLTIGAFNWITSGGDKQKLEGARNRIIHAIVGFLILVATWAILGVVGKFLGIDILILKPDEIIKNLKITP